MKYIQIIVAISVIGTTTAANGADTCGVTGLEKCSKGHTCANKDAQTPIANSAFHPTEMPCVTTGGKGVCKKGVSNSTESDRCLCVDFGYDYCYTKTANGNGSNIDDVCTDFTKEKGVWKDKFDAECTETPTGKCRGNGQLAEDIGERCVDDTGKCKSLFANSYYCADTDMNCVQVPQRVTPWNAKAETGFNCALWSVGKCVEDMKLVTATKDLCTNATTKECEKISSSHPIVALKSATDFECVVITQTNCMNSEHVAVAVTASSSRKDSGLCETGEAADISKAGGVDVLGVILLFAITFNL